MFRLIGKGLKAVATGTTQEKVGLQSAYLPGAVVRLGRAFYVTVGVWIGAVWYSGYANMRTEPGSGPSLVLPGKPVINPPDRPNPQAGWAAAAGGGGGSGSGGGGGGGGSTPIAAGTGGGQNPFPGAVGSRLDQGFDLTSKTFNAPDTSRIVYASQSNSGWRGGGVVAGILLTGPRKGKVWGYTEGISPVVRVGQIVQRGQRVGIAVQNPYNGSIGNIESGWMNPAAPTQPLAQVSANPASATWDWYRYIRSLGGPVASSTGNAGRP